MIPPRPPVFQSAAPPSKRRLLRSCHVASSAQEEKEESEPQWGSEVSVTSARILREPVGRSLSACACAAVSSPVVALASATCSHPTRTSDRLGTWRSCFASTQSRAQPAWVAVWGEGGHRGS